MGDVRELGQDGMSRLPWIPWDTSCYPPPSFPPPSSVVHSQSPTSGSVLSQRKHVEQRRRRRRRSESEREEPNISTSAPACHTPRLLVSSSGLSSTASPQSSLLDLGSDLLESKSFREYIFLTFFKL